MARSWVGVVEPFLARENNEMAPLVEEEELLVNDLNEGLALEEPK